MKHLFAIDKQTGESGWVGLDYVLYTHPTNEFVCEDEDEVPVESHETWMREELEGETCPFYFMYLDPEKMGTVDEWDANRKLVTADGFGGKPGDSVPNA